LGLSHRHLIDGDYLEMS